METGILLATALPNRNFLLLRAGMRLGGCLVAWIVMGVSVAQPATSPIEWLVGVLIWLSVSLVLFFWGISPLRLLTRQFEWYETAFTVHDQTIPLDRVRLFVWRCKRLRLAGIVPTDRTYLQLTCYLFPDSPKHKRETILRYDELGFSALLDSFELAYEGSLPTEYHLTLPPALSKAASDDWKKRVQAVISGGMRHTNSK